MNSFLGEIKKNKTGQSQQSREDLTVVKTEGLAQDETIENRKARLAKKHVKKKKPVEFGNTVLRTDKHKMK